jgi:prepilin-type N-terminal cleavage/methylation domain-containing protein
MNTITNEKGFTLIELIIVMVIIAILGASVNALLGDTASTKAYGTARKIQSDIIFAQESAMTHRVHYRMTFTSSPNRYTVQQCSSQTSPCPGWNNINDPSTNTSPFTVTLNIGSYSGVSWTGTIFNCNYLEFNSAGNPLEGDSSNCANPPLLFSTTGATIRTVALNTTTRYVTVLAGTGKTAVYP